MPLFIIALLASHTVLPTINRDSLDLQARAEALYTVRAQSTDVVATRPASSAAVFRLSSITTICRAAGKQADPAFFIETIGQAYGLDAPRRASLRSSCAAYLAGRADAPHRH